MNTKYKPIYKKFLRLRENITGTKKIKLLKKKKTKLNKFLNHSLYQVSKNAKSFKNFYKSQLIVKQKVKLYYTKLSDKQLKILCKKASVKGNLSDRKKKFDLLIGLFENRIDTVLYRSNIVANILMAKQIINHGHVFVNNKKVISPNYFLNPGDLIEFSHKITILINKNLLSKKISSIVPSYLEINKNIFKLYYTSNLSFDKLLGFFPFWLDLNNVISHYNK